MFMKKTKAVVYFRRKREGRTDYRKRLALLKSRLPRLVVRKSNKHMIIQLVSYEPDGDKVLLTARSTELKKFGWTGATGNIPAAYLTGYLLAKKAKKEKAIVDIGYQIHQAGSRIYAAVKGAKDGGLDVACSEKVFPNEDRITGKHCKIKDFEGVKKKIA
jgi:large subunit ribosomal protein L18